MRNINSSVRGISVSFKMKNLAAISAAVQSANPEMRGERTRGVGVPVSGVQIIESTPSVSLVQFVEELEAAGYVLVEFSLQERRNIGESYGQDPSCTLRYFFVKPQFDRSSEEFKAGREIVLAGLKELARTAAWSVRAYNNPFYENGEATEDRVISVNMEARQPLFLPDGKPVVARPKDASGRRISHIPVPISAERDLRILDDELVIV